MAESPAPVKLLTMLKPVKEKSILTIRKQTSKSYMSQGLKPQTHSMEADDKPVLTPGKTTVNTSDYSSGEIITNAHKGTRV